MNQTQKHTTGKKLLALLLALIMSVSLLPMSVFAADLEQTDADGQPAVEQGVDDAVTDETDGQDEEAVPQEPVTEDPAPVEEPTEDVDATDDIATQAGDVAVQADAFTVDEASTHDLKVTSDADRRAVMLDCGRKYFSVDNIKKLIDTMAQYGYNQLQLSFGNGGCRFLLDDMSLSFKNVTMTSDTVKDNITKGNSNFNGDTRYLNESNMDTIIAYANSKDIEIVPMLNMPGHATAIVYGTNYSSSGNLDVTNETGRYYGYALLKKYVDYFAGKGCKYFSFGADESGYSGTNMTAFLTGCANIIADAGMIPRAFNDATNVATMPTSVQITYWHQENGSKSASALANAGYEMINTHGRWYYVIKTAKNSEIGTKYWQGTVNTTATSVELPVMKAEKMDSGKWVGLNEYFDADPNNGSKISGSKGTMFCIWCDASQDAYLTDSDVISDNEDYGALYQLEKLAEHYWPDDIKKDTGGDTGKTVDVSLKVGESKNYTQDGDVTGNIDKTGFDENIATFRVSLQPFDDGVTYEPAQLESGTFFVSDQNNDTAPSTELKFTKRTSELYYIQNQDGEYVYPTAYFYYGQKTPDYGYTTSSSPTGVGVIDNGDGSITVWRNVSTYLGGTTSYLTFKEGSFGGSGSSNNIYIYEQKAQTTNKTAITFTGKKVGNTSITIGNVKYNIKVTELDLSNVTPLSVELWVTNRHAGGTHNGKTYPATAAGHVVSVSAEAAYGPDGVTLESLVPTTGTDEGDLPLLYWKGTLLSSSNKQTYTGTDMSGAGSDFQKIRYYEDSWQYYSNNTWTNVLSTDQIIAYYMQVYNTSPEIVTAFRDYGGIAGDGGGEYNASWFAGYKGVGTAVVYSDKSMAPDGDEGIWNNTLICYYVGANGGDTPGLIKVFDTEDFQITKITITKGVHQDSTGATGADATKTWNKTTSSVLWDKTTNDAGDEWYDETVIWTAEGHTPGETITLDDSIWGDTWKTSGIGEAFLLLFYVEPVAKEDNLEVVYWDDSADQQINPNDIMISVKDGVTFINGIKQTSAVNTGVFTLDDNATIENSVGVSQRFNKNITILEGVAANYRSGIYEYYQADISADGKTLTLHYKLKSVESKHQFVVDFGLPVEFTDLLSWFNVEDVSTVDYLSVSKANKLTESTGSWGSVKINENTWDSMTYTLDKMLSAAATIPLYCKLTTGTQTETQIEVIPASTVYYEDSFATFTNGAGAAADATWSTDGATTNANQLLEELGNKQNLYGYDTAYDNCTTFSMGSAQKVTVDADMAAAWDDATSAWPTATFTFKGTGFDVISLTDNRSGAIVVKVYEGKDTSGKLVKSYIVNNYYGYQYNDATKTWEVSNESGANALYQIPVMKIADLTYGEYTAVIKVSYGAAFDFTNSNSYSFWLDAIRVYDPMGENADYAQDGEGWPQYIKLRTELKKNVDDEKTMLFIDGADQASVADYANYGPNNEVYLAKGQAISFKLTGDLESIATVQIGAKSPDGTEAKAKISVNNQEIASATEMYYDITTDAKNGEVVTIVNNGADDTILSLTNLKVTFTGADKSVSLAVLNAEDTNNAVAAVRALLAAPVEPDPEPEVFVPEYFQATWNRGTVKVGQKATLTVKTSADVEAITVDGKTIDTYRTRTERTGWGWNATKVTYHVFTFTVTAAEAGTLNYSIVAANADGVNSEAFDVPALTVQAASQRPGIGGWLDQIFGRWF